MIKNQVIIQARMGSSRLPGKVLLPLNGRPVLEYVVRRSAAAVKIENIVVATTDHPEDDAIEEWCRENSVDCVRGSSEDALDRYLLTAKLFPCENIVRVTADCPLVDPGIIDTILALHCQAKADYTSNVAPPTFPVGFDVEAIRTSTLKKVSELTTLQSHREHVTLYIREHLSDFVVSNLESGLSNIEARLTLDHPEDYQVLKNLFEYFPSNLMLFSFYEIMDVIARHPTIVHINSHIDRYEGVKKAVAKEHRKLSWD